MLGVASLSDDEDTTSYQTHRQVISTCSRPPPCSSRDRDRHRRGEYVTEWIVTSPQAPSLPGAQNDWQDGGYTTHSPRLVYVTIWRRPPLVADGYGAARSHALLL